MIWLILIFVGFWAFATFVMAEEQKRYDEKFRD